MKPFRSLALILGSKPPGKGGKAPKDMKRPGLKAQYLDEVKDAFKDRDAEAFTEALEGLINASVSESE